MAENILRKLVFGEPVSSVLIVDTLDSDAAPIAEHLLRSIARDSSGSGGTLQSVSSAGISGELGLPMSERAKSYLSKRGISSDGFTARRFDPHMAYSNQLTLASDMAVKGVLLFLAPGAQIYTVSEYSLTGSDIPPMERLDDESYLSVCDELGVMMARVAKRATRNKTF